MGRQTRFFATHVDLAELLRYAISKGGRLLNRMGEELSLEEAVEFLGTEGEHPDFYSPEVQERLVHSIAIPDAVMVYHRTTSDIRYVDQSNSEVIEVSVVEKVMPVLPTRPTADPLLPIINGYKGGRFWYSREGFDSERMEFYFKPHEKELTKLFNSLHRYIRKNYRIDTTKSDYIGPDAYQGYLNGTFVPCQGQHRFYFEDDSQSAEK